MLGVWGKVKMNRETGEILSWLPLASHCLDVAFSFRALCHLPLIRRRLDAAAGARLSDVQIDRLAVIALLHDLGKANLGFQDKVLRPDAPKAGHIQETAALFFEEDLKRQLCDALDVDTLCGWFAVPDGFGYFLIAALSHHGSPIRFDDSIKTGSYHLAKTRWWRPDGRRDPIRCIGELLGAARRAFPRAFEPGEAPIPIMPALQHRYAGLVMLADWLGSHEGFFPYSVGAEDRAAFADRAAVEMLKTVGLDVRAFQADLAYRAPNFSALFGFGPRPLQRILAELPAGSADAHRLLIAEAETGSGKTEAALARFFTLFAAGAVDGLYFALPTRVAARELYGRVLSYVEGAFPDPAARPMVLLAAPGYARVDGVDARIVLPDATVRWDDAEAQRRRERAWAAERPKRFLAATVAVGTIDQALLSALQTPHAHLRSVCLDRHLLIVDEVHASDPYMRRLLKHLLDHHLSLGGHALLLSATLGAVARAELLAAASEHAQVPDLAAACAAPYPAWTDRSGVPQAAEPDTAAPGDSATCTETVGQKAVRVEPRPELLRPERLLPEIAAALQAGTRVLVVLNTVGRAIALQRAAEAAPEIPAAALFRCAGIATPHHGRYAPVDRELLDAAVSARFGKGSEPGPVLLIGTQTLEQSLDIDADLLITDLCPVDMLLQRIGRLHRHPRVRPWGYALARCVLLTHPDPTLESLLRADGAVRGIAGLGRVYTDLRVLRLTAELFAAAPDVLIPRDNRRLVEGATHPERLAMLNGERWQRHGQKVSGEHLAQEVRAQYAALAEHYAKSFGSFDFKELSAEARTRLGLGDRRIRLSEAVHSPFGQSLEELVIPGFLAPEDDAGDAATVIDRGPQAIRFRFGPFLYGYSRLGLERLDECDESAV